MWSKRLKRNRWIEEIEQNVAPGAEIGMEACGGAHHWARALQSKGYRVRLIAPQFVKPYFKSNKTDANDAQAVCEAMSRPSMRYVAVKTIEQQDIQAVHRVHASLISERGAKANQLRGLAYEYGLVAPREIAAHACGSSAGDTTSRAAPPYFHPAAVVRSRRRDRGCAPRRTLDQPRD